MPKLLEHRLRNEHIVTARGMDDPLLVTFLKSCPSCTRDPMQGLMSEWFEQNPPMLDIAVAVFSETLDTDYFQPFARFMEHSEPLPNEFFVVRPVHSSDYPLGSDFVLVRPIFKTEDSLRIRAAVAEESPFRWDSFYNERLKRWDSVFLFGKRFWTLESKDRGLNEVELALRFRDTVFRDKKRWERIEGRVSARPSSKRKAIPVKIQSFVLERDGRQCVQCGSQTDLQFDHIIPLEAGGSNTAQNIQVLCLKCNLEKADSI